MLKATGSGRVVVLISVLCFVWAGACFGFNGLKPVLLSLGIHSEKCHEGTAASHLSNKTFQPCGEQLDQIDFAFSFSSSMLNIFAFPNGIAIDALGMRRICFISSVTITVAALPFGFSTRGWLSDFFPLIYFAMIESGVLLLLGGMSLQGRDPGTITFFGHPFAVSVICAPLLETSFALATVIFPILGLVFQLAPTRNVFEAMYTSYALSCAVLVCCAGFAMSAQPFNQPALGDTFRRWGSPWPWLTSLAVGAAITQQGFYMATIAEQFAWHGHEQVLLTVFNWGFPLLSLPAMMGIAKLEELLQARGFGVCAKHGYYCLAGAQAMWVVCSVVPLWPLQFWTLFVFIVARILSFVHFYAVVAFLVPSETFGRMAGSCLSLGGILSMALTWGLQKWYLGAPMGTAAGSPIGPNLVLGLALTATNVCAGLSLPVTHDWDTASVASGDAGTGNAAMGHASDAASEGRDTAGIESEIVPICPGHADKVYE